MWGRMVHMKRRMDVHNEMEGASVHGGEDGEDGVL